MKTLKLNLIVLLMLTMNFAQSQEKEKAQMKQMQTEKTAFACPMHCEGEKTYDKAGSCPKCGMDLKKMEMKKNSMKINMDHSKTEMMDMKMSKAYTCPMHADVKSDKPGACSKCGMELQKTGNVKNHQCCGGMKTECDSAKTGMDHSKMEMKHDSTEMKMDHSKMTKTFVCPMHPEVTSNNSGKCPKCGMDMKEMNEQKMEENHKH